MREAAASALEMAAGRPRIGAAALDGALAEAETDA
jgi:hypothetical protein